MSYSSQRQPAPSKRPDFMVILGLLPPYTSDDVKQAYLQKVKTAHPDVGGNVADFLKLQEAFRQATEYVEFRQSRMSWLASHMDRYVAQSQVVDRLTQLGGRVETQQVEWLEQSFGTDFSQIMESVVAIHIGGPEIGDEVVELLVREHALLHRLSVLDLSGSRITDSGLRCLRIFSSLAQLDIRGIRLAISARQIVQWFPQLHWLGIEAAGVRLLDRLLLRLAGRQVVIETSTST